MSWWRDFWIATLLIVVAIATANPEMTGRKAALAVKAYQAEMQR